MKRIYVGLAALLFFIIIGAGIYLTNQKAENRNVTASQNIPNNTAQQANAKPDGTVVQTPLTDKNQPVADNCVALKPHTARHRHRLHGKRNRHHDYNNEDETTASTGYTPSSTPPRQAPMNYEQTKEYNAIIPPQLQTTTSGAVVSPTRPGRIHFGIEAGLTQNRLRGGGFSDMPVVGFRAGGTVSITVSDWFAIQPGLLYARKGSRIQNELDATVNEKLALNYIEVPLNLVLKLGNVNNTRLLLGASPYAAYLLSSRDNFSAADEGDVLNPPRPRYNTTVIRKLDWGIGGFIGCETPEGIYAKAGLESSLQGIQQNSTGSGYSLRNVSMMLSFGYIFGY